MAGRGGWLERTSGKVTAWTGSSMAFAISFGVILVWAVTGPFFDYSNTWQLVINTGTTIVTFLMVFLIQRSQNKDSRAIHLKLNELVAAVQGASNRLISVEDLSEKDIHAIQKHFHALVRLARDEEDVTCSHSVEEANHRHAAKRKGHPSAGKENAREPAAGCAADGKA